MSIEIPLRQDDNEAGSGSCTAEASPSMPPAAQSRTSSAILDRDRLQQAQPASKRRKVVGSLRPAQSSPCTREQSPDQGGPRRLTNNVRQFPKRNVLQSTQQKPTAFDRLIVGMWRQLYGDLDLNPQGFVDIWHDTDDLRSIPLNDAQIGMTQRPFRLHGPKPSFRGVNRFCRQITQASRCCRSMEVIIQARWVQCFDEQVQNLAREDSELSITRARTLTLAEASKDFGWSVKELRNKM
jgi:ATP-dependent RNA helicase DDX49/DBP8